MQLCNGLCDLHDIMPITIPVSLQNCQKIEIRRADGLRLKNVVIYMYIGQKWFDFVEILLLLQMLLRNKT